MKKTTILLLTFITICCKKEYQFKKEKIYLGIKNSFRGVCLAKDNTLWIGGSKGCFLRSTDLGETWKVDSIKKYNTLDFRSSWAKDKNNAILLSAGSPAIMLETFDEGKNWQEIFVDSTKTVFFDSMKKDIAVGDPQGNTLDILKKTNGVWSRLDSCHIPKNIGGESCFAASNTCIDYDEKSNIYWIGLAGEKKIRVYRTTGESNYFKAFETPMSAGKARGIYSIKFKNATTGVAVGGSYLKPNDPTHCAIYSNDGGKTWKLPTTPPSGYKSCVTYFKENIFIAVGTTGVDISYDNGKNWQKIDNTNLNALVFFKGTNIAIGVSNYGIVYKYIFF